MKVFIPAFSDKLSAISFLFPHALTGDEERYNFPFPIPVTFISLKLANSESLKFL